jgi:3-hydroxybutyryl-CoA dehydrogenase
MTARFPTSIDSRPVCVVGGGTLGRRIAVMLATRGGLVRIVDPAERARTGAIDFVRQELPPLIERLPGHIAGTVEATPDLGDGVQGAWLVIKAIPERLDLKIGLFIDLERVAPTEAILATNSSSYPSRLIAERLAGQTRTRVLNTHFYQPPTVNAVELMSCGETSEQIIDGLVATLPRYGLTPFVVRTESVGFIFNRIWAAIKRESLAVVAEGVSTPADVDRIYTFITGIPMGPFQMMDHVGLDVVLDIEEHYAAVRDGIPRSPRTLLQDYINRGRLGVKTRHGFFDYI